MGQWDYERILQSGCRGYYSSILTGTAVVGRVVPGRYSTRLATFVRRNVVPAPHISTPHIYCSCSTPLAFAVVLQARSCDCACILFGAPEVESTRKCRFLHGPREAAPPAPGEDDVSACHVKAYQVQHDTRYLVLVLLHVPVCLMRRPFSLFRSLYIYIYPRAQTGHVRPTTGRGLR